MSEQQAPQGPQPPNRWITPLLGFAIVAVAAAVLVVSNTDSVPVAWAGFEWDAPLWLILLVTFAAGAVLVPLGRRLVRSYRRRQRRKVFEYEEAVRKAAEEAD